MWPRNDTGSVLWFEAHDDTGDPLPLLVDEVVQDTVYVRQLDPGEVSGGRIPVEPGQHVVMTTPIAAVGLCASGEVGVNDVMFSLRVVPDGRAEGVVYGRTLRFGEPDDGRRVHARPGESFTLAKGSLTVELDAIDGFYRQVDSERPEGSLATALRVWFGIGTHHRAETRMLTTAAAYRLDAAQHLLRRGERIRDSLQVEGDLSGAQVVAKVDELIHLVQEGIVALARCISLIERGVETSTFAIPFPAEIESHKDVIKDVRDAYEHIDERAFGRVGIRGFPDERALMIFEHDRLVRSGVIEYLDHRLVLSELPTVLEACRTAIKALAGGPPVDSAGQT